jgi:hypothetical protein
MESKEIIDKKKLYQEIWGVDNNNLPIPFLFLTEVNVSQITSTEPLYSDKVKGFLWPNKWYYKHISRTYSAEHPNE